MAQFKLKIENGPSKFDLMLALFDNTTQEPRPVIFKLEGGDNLSNQSFIINGLERESGSGEDWNFSGFVWLDRIRRISEKTKGVHGYFSTQTRQGWVEMTMGE